MKKYDRLEEDEFVSRVFEESNFNDTISNLHYLLDLDFEGGDKIINVYSGGINDVIKDYVDRHEV